MFPINTESYNYLLEQDMINKYYGSNFKKNNHNRRIFLYSVLIFLTLFSVYKLRRNYKEGKLKNIFDFYFK